ncbi:hypothetical protein EVAR_13027_1 [Eumeta japonica]|uniref:Uncharacterized protein n=1 Tax=Eumeta variegata TaxID=151549 RepID=A0A4C1TY89_EUMVA|nr:hypothetical protein EVAR_13027_1 [Eumeta japonica]
MRASSLTKYGSPAAELARPRRSRYGPAIDLHFPNGERGRRSIAGTLTSFSDRYTDREWKLVKYTIKEIELSAFTCSSVFGNKDNFSSPCFISGDGAANYDRGPGTGFDSGPRSVLDAALDSETGLLPDHNHDCVLDSISTQIDGCID